MTATNEVLPTKTRSKITTNDVEGPAESEIDMPLGASVDEIARPDLKLPEGFSLDTTGGQVYMKDLQFMEEPVTFMASEVTDPNAENPIPIGVNCETKLIERGKEYTLPRKFLNVLICREDKVTTVNKPNADGTENTVLRVIPSLKYPVHVISDPSGKTGFQWFQWKCKTG